MNKLDLVFPQNITEFDPGAEISVQAEWSFSTPPSAIEVRLVWSTLGKGDRDLKVVKTVRLDSPASSDQQIVSITLPWGPYSFSGKLISLVWAVELIAVPDIDSVRREITVAPRGQEVLLKEKSADHDFDLM